MSGWHSTLTETSTAGSVRKMVVYRNDSYPHTIVTARRVARQTGRSSIFEKEFEVDHRGRIKMFSLREEAFKEAERIAGYERSINRI